MNKKEAYTSINSEFLEKGQQSKDEKTEILIEDSCNTNFLKAHQQRQE